MKSISRSFVCVFFIACTQAVLAQPGLTVSQALDFWITKTEEKVVSAADAMPEEKYSFAPVAGEFAGVRTFAQQVKHLAACNYRMAAYMLGQTPTPDQEAEIGPETVRSKAEIMEYLRGSFAATHRAVGTLNEGNLVTTLAAGPSPKVKTRLQLAVLVVGHPNDHYGQMVEYLRMNGIVPPASRAAGAEALAQTRPSVSEALDYWISSTEREVVPAAEAMPERKYSFAPSGDGFGGVRTFGEQLKHLAANNYRMAAYISGRKPTQEEESETGPAGVQSKAEIVDYLKGSFEALHRAAAQVNEGNMVQPLGLPFKQNTRLQLAVDAVAHSYDHYGQIVEYLRMNGIIPPASRR